MIRSKLSMSVYKFPVKKLLKQLGFAETDDIVKIEFDGNEAMFLIKSDITEDLDAIRLKPSEKPKVIK